MTSRCAPRRTTVLPRRVSRSVLYPVCAAPQRDYDPKLHSHIRAVVHRKVYSTREEEDACDADPVTMKYGCAALPDVQHSDETVAAAFERLEKTVNHKRVRCEQGVSTADHRRGLDMLRDVCEDAGSTSNPSIRNLSNYNASMCNICAACGERVQCCRFA